MSDLSQPDFLEPDLPQPDSVQPDLPALHEVWHQTLGWQPTEAQQSQFQKLYEQILEGNRLLNLTRITEPQEFWEKHLWDSLVGIKPWLTDIAEAEVASEDPQVLYKVIDIGTGCGFPGVPVAIARPDWFVTLLDSTRKKLVFLDSLLASLGITNAQTWVERAEQLGKSAEHREQYDLVLIRAVASAVVCAQYCLPLLKVGGTAVLYRGQWTEEEAIALKSVVIKLGGEVEAVEAVTTPLSQGVRHCVHLKKVLTVQKKLPQRRDIE
ncbi:MAG: 16S rRNA (guanine(527)-N(7))-methyltransferase RsmG [Timaviella obliquedivisa GSE-PSE-MK23-08B]|nr:16S rRNA (guanine(527)-N(7))-methyltransferase RsmG [Timaviella obliquedivisa GSE-PSE-MK23-08B]